VNIHPYTQRGEKYLGRGVIFQKRKENKKTLTLSSLSKKPQPPSHRFFLKKGAATTPLKKENRDHSLERESPLHLPISQTQQKRTPFNLQKPPYRLSSGVAGEAFVFFFPSS